MHFLLPTIGTIYTRNHVLLVNYRFRAHAKKSETRSCVFILNFPYLALAKRAKRRRPNAYTLWGKVVYMRLNNQAWEHSILYVVKLSNWTLMHKEVQRTDVPSACWREKGSSRKDRRPKQRYPITGARKSVISYYLIWLFYMCCCWLLV